MSTEISGSFAVTGTVMWDPTIRPSIMIGSLVTIRPDGTIEYGPNYTPDAAAKVFWDAIGLERKQRV
jgi:hypothetical protein